MLYLIGVGLCNEKSLTIEALDAIKNCDEVFLENYTSILQCSKEALEKITGKRIMLANRKLVESHELIKKAKEKNIALLIIGDVFSATTHITLFLEAKKQNVEIRVMHNASILTAIGITGLELYKFGRTASIPFHETDYPIEVLKQNQQFGLHTLFLLDLDPGNNRFLTIAEACDYLIKKGILPKTKALGCARIGCFDHKIVYAELDKLRSVDFGKPPYCLVIPGKLHFVEEEMLSYYEIK
ncbi:diphthine synthase [Candidatus Woesearchaeota archaeon]|nr:diphthine synthase [Candidatus Woesearchaeota archaeon]RLE40760.1 MAG: diphthine synthase [Candidatus Woesearchaeota archaeon]